VLNGYTENGLFAAARLVAARHAGEELNRTFRPALVFVDSTPTGTSAAPVEVANYDDVRDGLPS